MAFSNPNHSKPRKTKNDRPFSRGSEAATFSKKKNNKQEKVGKEKGKYTPKKSEATKKKTDERLPKMSDSAPVRLNKFLANAGVASRREADRLIQLGLVSVNGTIIHELGVKINPKKDVVKYDDVVLRPEIMRYVILNKPKDYITTMDDPESRHTVMELIKSACKERIYPVGRLDRNTTGLLLFTNDGELAKRLTHPRNGFPKLYHVETNEKITEEILEKMRVGITLEDGLIKADEAEYVADTKDYRQVGIRLHSGKNRIVRRMFEYFGLTVKKLDRVMFAGLTKKDLPRGRYRHLSEKEVNFLKMIR